MRTHVIPKGFSLLTINSELMIYILIFFLSAPIVYIICNINYTFLSNMCTFANSHSMLAKEIMEYTLNYMVDSSELSLTALLQELYNNACK